MRFDRSFIGPGSLANLVPALWRQQVQDWPRLSEALNGLRQCQTRAFRLEGSSIIAQYNPARQASAAAKVDPASLAARPCFLCMGNLPKEQCAIVYRKDWLILCNPAPLFEPHFTITAMTHQPQGVHAALPVMLELVRDLSGNYTLFYNGPQSGASAPDHMHLQAAPVTFLPHEKEITRHLCSNRADTQAAWVDWLPVGSIRVGVSRPGHRPTLLLIGRSSEDMQRALTMVLDALQQVRSAEPEPMLNLFATYADDCWTVWLYPRCAHRPSCYGSGPEDFLLSPGAADVAGLLIVPRQDDFTRLNDEIIARIYGEILFDAQQMEQLRGALGVEQ